MRRERRKVAADRPVVAPGGQEHLRIVWDGLATELEGRGFLKIGRSKMYQLMATGQLPFVKIGKCRRIPWAALREFAARNLQCGWRGEGGAE